MADKNLDKSLIKLKNESSRAEDSVTVAREDVFGIRHRTSATTTPDTLATARQEQEEEAISNLLTDIAMREDADSASASSIQKDILDTLHQIEEETNHHHKHDSRPEEANEPHEQDSESDVVVVMNVALKVEGVTKKQFHEMDPESRARLMSHLVETNTSSNASNPAMHADAGKAKSQNWEEGKDSISSVLNEGAALSSSSSSAAKQNSLANTEDLTNVSSSDFNMEAKSDMNTNAEDEQIEESGDADGSGGSDGGESNNDGDKAGGNDDSNTGGELTKTTNADGDDDDEGNGNDEGNGDDDGGNDEQEADAGDGNGGNDGSGGAYAENNGEDEYSQPKATVGGWNDSSGSITEDPKKAAELVGSLIGMENAINRELPWDTAKMVAFPPLWVSPGAKIVRQHEAELNWKDRMQDWETQKPERPTIYKLAIRDNLLKIGNKDYGNINHGYRTNCIGYIDKLHQKSEYKDYADVPTPNDYPTFGKGLVPRKQQQDIQAQRAKQRYQPFGLKDIYQKNQFFLGKNVPYYCRKQKPPKAQNPMHKLPPIGKRIAKELEEDKAHHKHSAMGGKTRIDDLARPHQYNTCKSYFPKEYITAFRDPKDQICFKDVAMFLPQEERDKVNKTEDMWPRSAREKKKGKRRVVVD